MKKINIILAIIFFIVIIILGFRFIIGGDEDIWLCQDGEWVKYGSPSVNKPASGCGEEVVITNFNECLKASNLIMESYPRQCRNGDQIFTEDIGNELEKIDMIRIDYPRPNQKVSSPLLIEGEARGYWFFEGDFPVKLYNISGDELAIGIAKAQSNWMTEDFVKFKTELIFDINQSGVGELILEKDNPSGLPENEDSLILPVKF